MNPNNFRNVQFNFSGLGCWIALFAIIWLLGSVGLGWLVKSFFVLLAFIILAPIVAFLGLQWWLRRNLVEDNCPVCDYSVTTINNAQFRCPSCGEPLKAESGEVHRLTPPGTIDVEVETVDVQTIDVQPPQIEEGK